MGAVDDEKCQKVPESAIPIPPPPVVVGFSNLLDVFPKAVFTSGRGNSKSAVHTRGTTLIMAQEWFFYRNGEQRGPISSAMLKDLVRKGRIARTDLVWREGLDDWTSAGEIKGLFRQSAPGREIPATASKAKTAAPNSTGVSANRSTAEKFCHACGATIDRRAEICPKCGVRQPSVVGQVNLRIDDDNDPRGMLTTPVLISAIGNVAVGIFWVNTCIGIPLGIAMFILCIFEFMFYSDSDRLSPQQLLKKVGTLAIWEIVCGLFNLVSLICGILLLINKGKYERAINARN